MGKRARIRRTDPWAQASRRHSSITPSRGFPSSQVCQLSEGQLPPPLKHRARSKFTRASSGADCQPWKELFSLQPFTPRGNSQSELHLTPGPATLGLPGSSAVSEIHAPPLHHISPQPLIGPSPSSCSCGGGVGFFLFFFFLMYFLAMLGLHCCMGLFSSCSRGDPLWLPRGGFLSGWISCCGARAQHPASVKVALQPHTGSVVVAYRLGCSLAWWIFMDLRWQADFLPLSHQRTLRAGFFMDLVVSRLAASLQTWRARVTALRN